MAAGPRRERVTFQQKAVDENGDRLGDWEGPGITRWARLVHRTRGEVALQQRLQGQQPTEVTILADSETRTITSAWRMVWNYLPYAIQAVAPGEDRSEITLLAVANQTDE
jgi:hypothetical protein